MVTPKLHIRTLALLFVLLLSGMTTEAWAYKVRYHILTLPMNSAADNSNTLAAVDGKRMEAVRVIVENTTQVGLPPHFKSPLATNFKYYASDNVTNHGASAIYEARSNNKYVLYTITNESTTLAENEAISKDCDIYVTYEYDENNTIAKLDGSEAYNIEINGRFMAFNKGRNNRLCMIPKEKVSGEQLASNEFVKVDVSGTGITTWWSSNKTPRATAESYFHFLFKYYGKDPYNITIRTAYEGDDFYIEKYNNDQHNLNRYYKWATVFAPQKTTDNLLFASDDNRKYTTINDNANVTTVTYEESGYKGYYRGFDGVVWNSFALLNNTDESGYIFMGSRMVADKNGKINDPSKSGNDYKYYYLQANNNELKYTQLTPSTATESYSSDKEMYDIHTFTFRVKTPFGNSINVDKKWTDAYLSQSINDHIPDNLKRKYVNIEGYYSDAEFTHQVTTFADAESSCSQEGEKYIIYVKYTASLPFNALADGGSYADATWYELTDAASTQADGKKLKWDGSVFKNNGANATYEKESEFAFIGDPYELRVIHRKATETNSANYYVGCADPSSSTNLGVSSTAGTHYSWEIPYDDTSGSFVLKEYGNTDAYWNWTTNSAGNSVEYSTTASTRIKVMEIGKLNYTFKIVDRAGNIAIQAAGAVTPFTSLAGNAEYALIPGDIRSPFIADETVTFSSTQGGDALTEMPGGSVGGDIFVSYTTTHLGSKNIKLDNTQQFNVKLNEVYIYYDETNSKILSNAAATDEQLNATGANPYEWRLEGSDPYAMKIYNMGKAQYVKVDSWANDQSLGFDATINNASRFIAMMSNNIGVYEVLAASGNTVYYHIGRTGGDGTETKIYNVATYPHGANELRFELASKVTVTYHLLDKAKNELFSDVAITSKNPRLTLPAEYVSPLVATYYYYKTREEALAALTADKDNPSSGSPISEVAEDDDQVVWVTYKVSNTIGFGTSHPYLLKFHNGKEYKLEDGADKLTPTKLKAIYPYCNGDGNLNIYGQVMRNEQMEGGANTRPRWVWYFESADSDPYHVKIHSKSTISFGGRSNTTYLHTQAVHFNQETDAPNKKRIVTGGNLTGITQVPATEYAILGTATKYKLLTTDPINDGETNKRRTVTSFEQYWKTYNMIKLEVLGIDKSTNEFSDDPATFLVPDDQKENLKTQLVTLSITDANDVNYVNGSNWHSYEAVASAVRWNGYNDVSGSNGLEKKKVERLEHWFQTFDMGDGSFDIEDADIPAVLVLLDRHGWEIMRKPIPLGNNDTEAGEKLAALKAYDSPMVKVYKFYSNATKVSGCHRYTLRMQNGAERDQIKVNGVHYTSTSLATLPSYVADRDLYVTYTVKEEYEKSYNASTSEASKFIILQNHQYASDGGSSITATAAPTPLSETIISSGFNDNALWYVQPNRNIDTEMGYPGATPVSYTDAENGFDPYNLQIKNSSTSKFFTIDMKKSILNAGVYSGDYTGGSLNVTLAAANASPISSPESYDHTTLQMTNQTFMAVQDAKGNMQLMPRFDHTRRINAFATLAASDNSQTQRHEVDESSPGEQTTFMVRPQVFDYRIIDNNGHVAMHYQMAGEYYPSIPEHFKSPLAKDFKYYKTLTDSNSDGQYEMETLADEITSSFAAADITDDHANIYVRYSYDESSDIDNDYILKGRWMTMSLGGKDAQYGGTLNADGSGIFTGTKAAESHQWQWKFLQNPMVSTSSRYVAPDPYAVHIYNRDANKAETDMPVAIKVGSTDRFVILTHPSGDYALAVASDATSYSFLNGGSMTEPSTTPASIAAEASFTKTSNTISDNAQVILTHDVTHTFTYRVITNAKLLAASQTQNEETANANGYAARVPEDIQTPLLNLDDYIYYGTVSIDGSEYTIDEESQIDNLNGLYDDIVYVRYPAFDRDKTPYQVPNERNDASPIAVGSSSNNVAIDLKGNLPYNIIWADDNMMRSSDGSSITDGGANEHKLSAAVADMWEFGGEDPYAIKIRQHKTGGQYVVGQSTLSETATKTFMLLKKDGYDYGALAVTGDQTTFLSGYGQETTTSNPTKFIPFALSVHHLIYHLVINTTGVNTNIPYRSGDESNPGELTTLDIPGTTQRDLATTYQLGETVNGQNYSHDAGKVSIGDDMEVPSCFYRPNCYYIYYVEGIYDDLACNTPNSDLNNRFKGLEIKKLMSDAALIEKTVRVNIAYGFDTGLSTNAGDGFVTSTDQNLWYTFETSDATPYLAHYTNAWGLQSMEGRETRYTNDYLWTPLGDPYGFVMYNRYMLNNSSSTTVMTADIADNSRLIMQAKDANAVYELLAEETTTPGYFLIHPVVNKEGTQYYVRRGTDNYAELSTRANASEWTFGLSPLLIQPYLERVGYVGGLKQSVYDSMDASLVTAIKNGTASAAQMMAAQTIVYNTDNIVPFTAGYYRLHSVPGTPGVDPVRYASGYLHDIERGPNGDGNESDAIPMHFYSEVGETGTFNGDANPLGTGFTETAATRGDIPVLATEDDPSTIFYLNGGIDSTDPADGVNPRVIMSTQGLYVKGNTTDTDHGKAVMTATEEQATEFSLIDIGGAVLLITDKLDPAVRNYLHYDQSGNKYDLKYYHNSPTNEARWCIEPANNQGLMLETHDGGDGNFYTTFCAPYDVALPAGSGSNSYDAYICTEWDDNKLYPAKVEAHNDDYAEGRFVPAGTPVIIRTTDNTGAIKLTLPSASPSSSISSCIFTGKYLEQKLATEITESNKVFAFGLPITGYGITTTTGPSNGEITNIIGRDQATKGVGFYINATPNKELGGSTGDWLPNNRYVLHNKIYYRATGGSSARGVEFVPVVFKSETTEIDGVREYRADTPYPGGVYNLQGRCVATEEQVLDGTWRQHLAPGIYIMNGRSIIVK